MTLKLKEIKEAPRQKVWGSMSISVTPEVHAQIKELSEKTGRTMRDMAETLMLYALENVEWEE